MSDTTILAAGIFFLFAAICAAVIQWLLSKIPVYKPPVSILWFLFGMLICVIEIYAVPNKDEHIDLALSHPFGLLGYGIAEAARVRHVVLFFLMLPMLLYDATQQISWHHFKKSLRVGILLAVLGVIIQVFVIGALMTVTLTRPGEVSETTTTNFMAFPWARHNHIRAHTMATEEGSFNTMGVVESNPSWPFSLMVASAVASTDPIAVLSILEEMDAPSKFGSIFDCESLINDGSSIFLFDFFKALTRGEANNWGEATRQFFRLLFVGPLFGYVVACLVFRWLKTYTWYPYDAALSLVFMAYLVFFVAELYLESSGPLSVVVFGLYFKAYSKATFDAETVIVHKHFTKGCATACTSVVFVVTGLASMRMMWDAFSDSSTLQLPENPPEINLESADPPFPLRMLSRASLGTGGVAVEVWRVPVFYCYMILARFLMVGVFYPIIRRSLGEFSWKEYVLLAWGGLRGAVCLILAVLIEQDDKINADLTASAALYIASSAFLVLFINGITFEFLYKMLVPYAPNPFRYVYLDKVTRLVEREYVREFPYLHCHWLFENCNILALADKLVPQLNLVTLDKQGRIHLDTPNVKKTLAGMNVGELTGVWDHLKVGGSLELGQADDETHPSDTEEDSHGARYQRKKSGKDDVSHSSSETSGAWRLQVKHSLKAGLANRVQSNVAAIQHLRHRHSTKAVDWKQALELVEGTEETNEEDKQLLEGRHLLLTSGPLDKLEGQTSKLTPGATTDFRVLSDLSSPTETKIDLPDPPFPSRMESVTISIPETRSLKWPSPTRFPSLQDSSSPVTQRRRAVKFRENSIGSSGSGFPRRIPGYRYDAVVHMRSDPHGAALDSAAIERMEKVLVARGLEEAEGLDEELGVPRARTEPKMGNVEARRMQSPVHMFSSPPAGISVREREGEVLIMIVNTMRQLYHNMYEQSFISGKVYSQLLSVGDVVTDYALLDVEKRNRAKVWRSVLINDPILTAGRVQLGRFASKGCEKKLTEKERMEWILQNFTGFDIEWNLIVNKLRGGTETKWYKCCKVCRKLFCRSSRIMTSNSMVKRRPSWEPETRWHWFLRKVLISSWSWLGTRSTFRTLDDLQMICAFVDVHSELLTRGDETLRQIIGPKMMTSFEAKIQEGKNLVKRDFPTRYPDSFPYAMICHAAIFLLNFKIQLVEEQYEKGLLMEADKEKICEVLKKQLYRVARYHPPFLFS